MSSTRSDHTDQSQPRRSGRNTRQTAFYVPPTTTPSTSTRSKSRRRTPVFTPTPSPPPTSAPQPTTMSPTQTSTEAKPASASAVPDINPEGDRLAPATSEQGDDDDTSEGRSQRGHSVPAPSDDRTRRTPFDVVRDNERRRHPNSPPDDDDFPMDDDTRRQRRQAKRPARGSPSPDRPPSHAPSGDGDGGNSAQSVSDLLSLEPHYQRDFTMSLSDVSKTFADVGKLTGPDSWPMWRFRCDSAMSTIISFYQLRGGLTVPSEVTRAVFNVMAGHIADSVMANYLNESQPHELMDKLRERFDPKTTVSDANEIFQLFHLRRPIYEMDKLLDDAFNFVGRFLAKGIDIPNHIFYSAIIGIIPPAYAATRASYEAGVRATTAPGTRPVYKPNALIAELRREFNNWCLTHPKTTESKGSSTLVPRDKPSHNHTSTKATQPAVERTAKTGATARAATAAPYSKEKADCSKMKCYNCNELGHTTPTCPQPWTEKSKAAMKSKGITRKTAAAAAKKATGAAATTTTPAANVASTSTAASTSSGKRKATQSEWVASLTDADVNMHNN